MKIIVFDLDGTLALDAHRAHHLRGPKPIPDAEWQAYFSKCEGDALNAPLAYIYECLLGNLGYSIEIWSGRSKSVEEQTIRWIDKHLFAAPDRLRMREAHDRTDDFDLKRQWLHEERAKGNEVTLVFEDRARVVEMWRAEGIVCAQVAAGDF